MTFVSRSILLIFLNITPGVLFADSPNAVNPKKMATEAVVVAMSNCTEVALKKLGQKISSQARLELTAIAYCSCMTDAMMAFPVIEATSKANLCMETASKKGQEVASSSKDVEFKNIFLPSSMTSLGIKNFFTSCISNPKRSLTNLEQDLWCSCLGDYIRELPKAGRTPAAIAQLINSKKTECGRYAEKTKLKHMAK